MYVYCIHDICHKYNTSRSLLKNNVEIGVLFGHLYSFITTIVKRWKKGEKDPTKVPDWTRIWEVPCSCSYCTFFNSVSLHLIKTITYIFLCIKMEEINFKMTKLNAVKYALMPQPRLEMIKTKKVDWILETPLSMTLTVQQHH